MLKINFFLDILPVLSDRLMATVTDVISLSFFYQLCFKCILQLHQNRHTAREKCLRMPRRACGSCGEQCPSYKLTVAFSNISPSQYDYFDVGTLF